MKNHVCTYDFVRRRLHDGRGVRMLTVMEKYTREFMQIRSACQSRSSDLVEVLSDLMAMQ